MEYTALELFKELLDKNSDFKDGIKTIFKMPSDKKLDINVGNNYIKINDVNIFVLYTDDSYIKVYESSLENLKNELNFSEDINLKLEEGLKSLDPRYKEKERKLTLDKYRIDIRKCIEEKLLSILKIIFNKENTYVTILEPETFSWSFIPLLEVINYIMLEPIIITSIGHIKIGDSLVIMLIHSKNNDEKFKLCIKFKAKDIFSNIQNISIGEF